MSNPKTEEELIEHYGGIAFDKQVDLAAVIDSNSWSVDMKKGEISFGTDLVFPFQILGSFSHASKTWLWAWANEASGLSPDIQQQALKLKEYGQANRIDLLTVSEFSAVKNDLHLIGMTAVGMFDASGYYIADYGQGAMVVTIKSDIVDNARKEEHTRILTAFPRLIAQFEMNHRQALIHYLTYRGYNITEEGATLTATKGDDKITATFDSASRITELNG